MIHLKTEDFEKAKQKALDVATEQSVAAGERIEVHVIMSHGLYYVESGELPLVRAWEVWIGLAFGDTWEEHEETWK